MTLEHNLHDTQSPAEAYTTYTNYRGPSLQGARRFPFIVIETKGKERKKTEKKRKKGEKKERKKKSQRSKVKGQRSKVKVKGSEGFL